MHDFASLIDDHDAVDALADRLIASARPGQAEPEICRALMIELAALLGRLFSRTAGASPFVPVPFAAQIDALKAEVADNWQRYVARWDERRIAAERSRYWGETTDLMTVFKFRLALS